MKDLGPWRRASHRSHWGYVTTNEDPVVEPRPSGLRSALDAIPDRCYHRSTRRGLGLFGRDLTLYGLAAWGLLSTDEVWLLLPLWLLAGLAVSGLFVIGHDAAHGALFDSRHLNAVVARVAMLPSLHATEIWIFGHNRVHHGHTLRQGMDFVWHPLTVDQYQGLGRAARWRHRFEWGPFGAGAYYLREVWWNKMVRFRPPARWRRAMRYDQALVAGFVLASLGSLLWLQGPIGVWSWAKTVVIPFLLFCQTIGWVVHVHHISPEIRWWPRRTWNRFRGQVEGTTVLLGPPGWDLFFHWILVHVPHHVDMRIPCYHLPDAARALSEAFPGIVTERPLRLREYVAATRSCKLYDFEAGHWLPYPSDDSAGRSPQDQRG